MKKNIFQRYSKRTSAFPPRHTAAARRRLIDPSLFSVTTGGMTLSLFSLMIPMLTESICNTMIGTVSTALISSYSENAVSALGAANVVLNLIHLTVSVVSNGSAVIISHLLGAGKKEDAAAAGWTTIALCILSAALFGGSFSLFSRPFMRAMHLQGQVLSYAALYLRIRLMLLPVLAATAACTAVLRCYGYPKATLTVNLIVSGTNYLFCLFVLRLPRFSPVTGVAGVACANVASQAVGLLVSLIFLSVHRLKIRPPKCFADAKRFAAKIVRVGLPSAVSNGAFALGQVMTTSFLGTIGEPALSAKVYFTAVLQYTYLFSANAGNANALLVGRLVGGNDTERADRMTRQLVRLTVPVNLLVSCTILLFRIPILSLFTANRTIFALSAVILPLDILAEQARAVSQVFEYSLRGAGDVVFSMTATVISCWVCSIGLGYLFGIVFGWGLTGVWIALIADETVRAVSTAWRWHSKKWCGKRT